VNLGVDEVRPAVIAIDLHRGHMDLSVATMPMRSEADARRLIDANRRFFDACRAKGIPVVHLVSTFRDSDETLSNPFWRSKIDVPGNTRRNALKHNLAGSPGCTIVPELHDAALDWVVDTKRRYDCFIGTDLDFRLRAHCVNTVLITGVNTNSCVLSTAAAACSRDYAVIVVQDCVDSMDGPAHHDAALLCIRTAFGTVASADEVLKGL
jgi:nicotinamidase-related amidase